MAEIAKKRSIYFATESTYATDPSASGTLYKHIPAIEIGDIKEGRELLDTNYQLNRQYPTAPIIGRDGASVDFTIPLIGLSDAIGDGESAPTDDWLDGLLTHIFGTKTTSAGEGVASSTSNTLVLDTDSHNIQELVAVYDAALTTGRSQWGLITVDSGGGNYSIAPNWTDNPTGTAIAYGAKHFNFSDDGGSSLSLFATLDSLDFLMLGCRCTSAKISVPNPGAMAKMSLGFSADQITINPGNKLLNQTSAGSGAVQTVPAVTPLKGLLSGVWFNGTRIPTQSIEIDFGLQTGEVPDTVSTNGRSAFELRGAEPTITVVPMYTHTLMELRRAGTKGRLLIQLGGGVLSGGVLNTICLHAEEAIVMDASFQDVNGAQGYQLQFKVTDYGTFSGTTLANFFQLARA